MAVTAHIGHLRLFEEAHSLTVVPPLPDKARVERHLERLLRLTRSKARLTVVAVGRHEQIKMAGGVCKIVNTTEKSGYKLVKEQFEEAITPKTKCVIINSPCNPTGEVLSAERMSGIVHAARSIGAVVLSDECYALMRWGAEGAAPCALQADVCGGSAEGVLVLYSLSKQSNMAGYRTAFIAGDRSLVEPMTAYRKQIGQIIPGPVQAAMAAGLCDMDAVRTQHARYEERLGTLVGALRAYGYCTDMPQGALYVWVKAKSGDCWEDMRQLAEIGIIASPGEFYGAPEYLRFSATASDEAIAAAAERLAR